ncbi:MAG: hypothetical protein H7146_06110 [Burkholderiaceae bacterium]|nr:hypothetical protein [Microbacteriaceae bacterium]
MSYGEFCGSRHREAAQCILVWAGCAGSSRSRRRAEVLSGALINLDADQMSIELTGAPPGL